MSTAYVNFDLIGRDRASSAFNSAAGSAKRTQGAFKGLAVTTGTLVKSFLGFYAVQKTVDFLRDSFDQAQESIKATGQTQAVLKSTGHAANVTAKDIGNLANALSLKSGIDDEVIQSGENVLLTFRNIRNETGKGNAVFDKATRLTNDLAVSMGKDMKSSAILVGKALNDPISGLTALTRVGVTFTEKQKDTIKTLTESGHRLEAQKMILSELRKEFGGSAAAQATAADKAKVAWQNLQEQVGKMLMPTLNKLLRWFTNDALPVISNFVKFLQHDLGPAIGGIKDMFAGASTHGDKLAQGFQRYGEAARNLYEAIRPIVEDIVNAVRDNWPQISATIGTVLTQAAGAITAFANLVSALWERFGSTIMSAVGTVWKNVYTVIGGALRMIKHIVQGFTAAINGDWGKAWKKMELAGLDFQKVISDLFTNGVNFWKGLLSRFAGWIGAKFTEGFAKAVTAAKNGISKLGGWIRSIPGKVKAWIGDLGHVLFDAGVQVIQGLIDGVTSKISDLQGKFAEITSKIPDWKGPMDKDKKLLEPTGKAIMDGLITGIKSKLSELKQSLAEVTDTIKSSFFTSTFDSGFTDVTGMKTFARAQLNQARQLARDIKQLVAWGMSPSLISQAVNSGGFEAVHALATSSKATVKDFNRINARTQKYLDRAGNTAGQAIYGDRVANTKKDLEDAVRKGMDGATLRIHRDGKSANLMVRGG